MGRVGRVGLIGSRDPVRSRPRPRLTHRDPPAHPTYPTYPALDLLTSRITPTSSFTNFAATRAVRSRTSFARVVLDDVGADERDANRGQDLEHVANGQPARLGMRHAGRQHRLQHVEIDRHDRARRGDARSAAARRASGRRRGSRRRISPPAIAGAHSACAHPPGSAVPASFSSMMRANGHACE